MAGKHKPAAVTIRVHDEEVRNGAGTDWSQTWTFSKANGARATCRLGRAHARDLARLVGVRRRARVRGRGARPRPALRARQCLGQDHVSQAERFGRGMVGLTRDGMKKFPADTTLYVRPMYWAERPGPMALPPDPDSTRFALTLYDAPMRKPDGFSVTLSPFRRPTHGERAGRRQGRLPLSEQRARHVRGEVARLRQLHRVRHARQRRRARQFQRVHGQGRRRVHADAERHVPRRHHPPARDQAAARRRRHGGRDRAALRRFRERRRDFLDRQRLQGAADHPHRRARVAARPALPQGARTLLGLSHMVDAIPPLPLSVSA